MHLPVHMEEQITESTGEETGVTVHRTHKKPFFTQQLQIWPPANLKI